jgi:hypothetical protein
MEGSKRHTEKTGIKANDDRNHDADNEQNSSFQQHTIEYHDF